MAAGAQGTYNLSGGTLLTSALAVGSASTGTFNQTGGTFNLYRTIGTTRPRAWSSSATPCRGPCAWPRTRARGASRSPTTNYQRRDYAAATAELALAGRTLPNEPRGSPS